MTSETHKLAKKPSRLPEKLNLYKLKQLGAKKSIKVNYWENVFKKKREAYLSNPENAARVRRQKRERMLELEKSKPKKRNRLHRLLEEMDSARNAAY